jgi:hypothetical protein
MTPSNRPAFPRVIDNTMRVTFVACPQKWRLRYLHHYATTVDSVNLHFGGVFARGLEVARRAIWDDGFSVVAALQRAFPVMAKAWGNYSSADEVKTFPRCIGALEYYLCDAYQPAVDKILPYRPDGKKAAIEWNFVLPIDVKHPETGEPILYAGRFDNFGLLNGQDLVIVDEKTTKQLGGQWAQKWRLRSQFTGYTWGARKFGHDVKACVVRGIGIYKHDYGTLESIVYRPQWHVDMWYEQLLRDVTRMVTAWETSVFDRALADPCADFGGCMFVDVCESSTPENWLSQYVIAPWDPLKRIEERQDV